MALIIIIKNCKEKERVYLDKMDVAAVQCDGGFLFKQCRISLVYLFLSLYVKNKLYFKINYIKCISIKDEPIFFFSVLKSWHDKQKRLFKYTLCQSNTLITFFIKKKRESNVAIGDLTKFWHDFFFNFWLYVSYISRKKEREKIDKKKKLIHVFIRKMIV